MMALATVLQVYSQTDSSHGAFAQENGVHFLENTSWSAVLQKAKMEHKYIFVDCYASWCGPCKWMDKNIYPNDTIGAAVNAEFLAVRVQMDSAKQDGDQVKAWYAAAHDLNARYHINEYPSYLFFSPDGEAIHKETGTKRKEDFLQLIHSVRDPEHQYYTLLARYHRGQLAYSEMPALAGISENIGEEDDVKLIVQDYIQHYLQLLPADKRWTKDNMDFLNAHSKYISSSDPIFKWYYADRKKIDSSMEAAGYADQLIDKIVYREEVKSELDQAKKDGHEPDWRRMKRAINHKYAQQYAVDNVLEGQIKYYRDQKEWKKYIDVFVQYQERVSMPMLRNGVVNPKSALVFLNNASWEVFEYSTSKSQLDTALNWINEALEVGPKPFATAMDTKANILYKLGRKEEAMQLEQQSCGLAANDEGIRKNYEKMKSGLPTWPAE